MNSAVPFIQAVKRIKATASRIEKLEILSTLANDSVAADLLSLIFDPRITFGVNKKLPALTGSGLREFDQQSRNLLRDLRFRVLTGKAAQEAIGTELGRLDPDSGDLLIAVMQQNLRAGFGVDDVNTVFPGLVPVFNPMLAHKFSKYGAKMDWSRGAWGDLKLDGVRGFSFSDSTGFCSRAGLPLSTTDALNEQTAEFLSEFGSRFNFSSSAMIDGELGALGGKFRDTMSQVRASKRGADAVGISVIDVISRGEFDAGVSELVQERRRARTVEFFAKYGDDYPLLQPVPGKHLASPEEAEAMFSEALADGEEGIIVKPYDGLWEAKRSRYWLKMKAEQTVDGIIVEVLAGDPLSDLADTAGAVRVLLPNGVTVKVAGMKRKMRDELWRCRDTIAGTGIEIEFHEYTPDGSLRHPRVKIIRDDK